MSEAAIRLDDGGRPDDIVIRDATLFRAERLDGDAWWVAVYRGERRIAFWFRVTRKGRLTATVVEDEIGCRVEGDERRG